MSGNEATALISKIKIHHPYGVVGLLPWQQQHNNVCFGGVPNSQQLLDIASQIKTFTEGTNPESSEIMSIRENVLNANTIVFLGFAFHELNMELILPSNFSTGGNISASNCYATSLGISESDSEIIRADILRRFKNKKANIFLKNISCSELFQEYWRSISLS